MAELYEGIICNGVGSGVGSVKRRKGGGGRGGGLIHTLAGERGQKSGGYNCFKIMFYIFYGLLPKFSLMVYM